MPLDETELKLLWDMLNAAERGVSHVAGMAKPVYMRDRKTQDAVERTFGIVGEAARRVSDHARRQVSGVQWGAIVATRHILAHEYGEVDQEEIWRIATVHLPELIGLLRPVLSANPPPPAAGMDPGEPVSPYDTCTSPLATRNASPEVRRCRGCGRRGTRGEAGAPDRLCSGRGRSQLPGRPDSTARGRVFRAVPGTAGVL
jgi:uncharacterized protein with HEPN domain